MTAETPSPTDAEVEQAIDWLRDTARWWDAQTPSFGGQMYKDVAAVLEDLLSARRSADARVAAAVLKERRALDAFLATGASSVSFSGPHSAERKGACAAYESASRWLAARPTPTGTDPLAALLAEAREAGIREAAEAISKAADEGMDNKSWDEGIDAWTAAQICEAAVLALIPTPEAPRDE